MYIERLRAERWRNLASLDLSIAGARMVVLEGANGQGKTNVLEALYLCATGRSFRLCPAGDMVRHGAEGARVAATLVREGVRHEVEISLREGSRQVRVDGRGRRDARQLMELLNMVAFFPDDLRIVKEGPERRRSFLDRAVANAQPAFVVATLAYHRALRARNALLRRLRPPEAAELAAYDRLLVEHGVVMHQHRLAFVSAWRRPAGEHLAAITASGRAAPLPLDLRLLGGVAAWDAPNDGSAACSQVDLAEGLRAALAAASRRDRARGLTSVGPHRADLACLLGGHPARAFASQGQQRAVVLALKLAEVAGLGSRWGTPPILLLDDVSSELDPDRTRALFAVINEAAGQVFLTTTDAARLPLPTDARRLVVRGGCLEAA